MLQGSPSRRVGGADCVDQPQRDGHRERIAGRVPAEQVQSDGGRMIYVARPVSVNAFKIRHVGGVQPDDLRRILTLENGVYVTATAAMLARMTPVPGDYWVIQGDGYEYVNPREVFEQIGRAHV